jgi:hypothetical protein
MTATTVYEFSWNVDINEPRHQGFRQSSLLNNNDSTTRGKETQKLFPNTDLILITEIN